MNRDWEERFRRRISEEASVLADPAHDLAHFERVSRTAKVLCAEEGAKIEIVLPASWLHDLVNVSKNDPRRSQASRLSAAEACKFLREQGYPAQYLDGIAHAIEAHSFTAGIEPSTLEARIVQDADRLDGLGAIGIARCFSVGGSLQRKMYDPSDLRGAHRPLDDSQFTVDHFFVKLFKVAESLKTRSGQIEGLRRAQFMRDFLSQLARECA